MIGSTSYNGGVNLKTEIKERIEMINRGEIPEGYKKTKIGIMPEDWEVKKLGEISEFRQGYQIPSNKQLETLSDGYIRYLYISDFISDFDITYVKKAKKFYIVEENDICVANTGNTGGKAFRGKRGVLSNNMFKIFNKADEIRNDFYWFFLNSWFYWKQLLSLFNIGGQPHVGHKNMSRITTSLPSISEQQKIAQILSTWDDAIELKEKLIDQKKEQKKGLMQRLLTGEVRLPGFDGEWEEVRLGGIGDTFNGLAGKTFKDFGEGKPFITYKNIFENSKIDIKNVDYVRISEDENQNTAMYGDIFFTVSSETPDEVGMSSVLLDDVKGLYLNSFCFGFRLNDFKTLVPKYARYLFRGNVFRKGICKLAQGSTRFNLSKAEVLKLYVKLPLMEEQNAIAQILSTADKEIDLLNQELEQLKLQKKGLMQLLLTGIVRVNI